MDYNLKKKQKEQGNSRELMGTQGPLRHSRELMGTQEKIKRSEKKKFLTKWTDKQTKKIESIKMSNTQSFETQLKSKKMWVELWT